MSTLSLWCGTGQCSSTVLRNMLGKTCKKKRYNSKQRTRFLPRLSQQLMAVNLLCYLDHRPYLMFQITNTKGRKDKAMIMMEQSICNTY
jgi:galactitol-specific phosphotransferase system IIB component